MVANVPDDEDMDPRSITLPNSVVDALRKVNAPEIEGTPEPSAPDLPHLSYSQIAMYLRCSFQYRFRYLLGLKEKPKVSLAIGKGGHAALEKNMKRKIKSGVDSPVEEVVQWASDFMDEELTRVPKSEVEVDVKAGETKDKFLAATKVFQTRDAPDLKPVGVETEFFLDLNKYLDEPEEHPIRIIKGKIDLIADDKQRKIVQHDGLIRLRVDDYKYVTRKKTQAEVNITPQLTTYASVIKDLTGKWPTRLGFRMLHPGTTRDAPDAILLEREAELMTPKALEARMRRLTYQFAKVEEGIRKEIFIPTDDPISCSWCGYRDRCQASLVDDFEAEKIREVTAPR